MKHTTSLVFFLTAAATAGSIRRDGIVYQPLNELRYCDYGSAGDHGCEADGQNTYCCIMELNTTNTTGDTQCKAKDAIRNGILFCA
ncbi:hypothetical protein Cob_v006891 [Colletotrichum orbiculare MAFF 240422]|uniref:Uncharacterized protein n=1 Tax=Colletotrichum orbiculare (strain 104-T / ATCC 96160 / CBS 514.97 / LARS 414 / MAFF 240422) TaxID=1213857 RepID=A0A484FPA5_COLOR|nr:hypothetical protein Cob_v006891 [Colletotrichum orbiculare MAFF 240422]